MLSPFSSQKTTAVSFAPHHQKGGPAPYLTSHHHELGTPSGYEAEHIQHSQMKIVSMEKG